MSYASLMVFLDALSPSAGLVKCAADVATKFTARLIGVSSISIPPRFAANSITIDATSNKDIEKMRGKLEEDEAWFRKTVGLEQWQTEFRCALEYPAEFLAEQARAADLVVIGQSKWPASASVSLNVGEAILTCGRPVLVVPENVSSVKADHVVIAWKDAREARRAVQDALPFLHEAARISIVGICDLTTDADVKRSLDDVAKYLTHHRLKGEPTIVPCKDGSGARELLQYAQAEQADLIVSGAYGHSRLGEWIFGGMTHGLLAKSHYCCLMSH